MANLYIAWSETLLPVPETRIGDLTMYIPSRGLLTRNGIISIRFVNLIVVRLGSISRYFNIFLTSSLCEIIRVVGNVQLFRTTPHQEEQEGRHEHPSLVEAVMQVYATTSKSVLRLRLPLSVVHLPKLPCTTAYIKSKYVTTPAICPDGINIL
ncbi:hypothetical protein M9H77_35345 [Catharanthus roseus]|uniref:Uncharacterized protein n=1 Tax=Catharanthus roseus TaxID=4058 RepID=A0ACB9ZP10_CATRO|nr:hypothetical protein M9H77_35345 [Catharanthus roseus]